MAFAYIPGVDNLLGSYAFGSRVLLDSRITYETGGWSIALWGRNLGDQRYVRAVASRGQIFFPTTSRPLDMIYGERRRFGVSVTYVRRDVGS